MKHPVHRKTFINCGTGNEYVRGDGASTIQCSNLYTIPVDVFLKSIDVK